MPKDDKLEMTIRPLSGPSFRTVVKNIQVPGRGFHPFLSGRYYDLSSQAYFTNVTNKNKAPNVLHLHPIVIPNELTVSNLYVRNTKKETAVCNVAIYRDERGLPKQWLANGFEQSLDPAGPKTFPMNLILTPNIYWLAMIHNHSSDIKFECLNNDTEAILGYNAPFTYYHASGVTVPHTYGTFPASIDPATITIVDWTYPVRIQLEVA